MQFLFVVFEKIKFEVSAVNVYQYVTETRYREI